jgi:hypothetical protein
MLKKEMKEFMRRDCGTVQRRKAVKIKKVTAALLLCGAAILLPGGCKNFGDGTLKGIVHTGPSHYTGMILGIMGATVTVYDTYDDSVAAVLATGATPADAGLYSVTLPPGAYRLKFEKEDPADPAKGYASEAYYSAVVSPATTAWLEPVTLISKDDDEPGGASGRIADAADGRGLQNTVISLRRGVNLKYGTPEYETTAGDNGIYSFAGLPAGQYTGQVTLDGYATGYFTLLSEGGEMGDAVIAQQNCTLVSLVDDEELRFVLTWGDELDLDVILTGPAAPRDRLKRFQVDSMDGLYSFNSLVFAENKIDDVDGYGPESICLFRQVPGTYRLYVYNFLDDFDQNNAGLSGSGARIDVYLGGTLIDTLSVPACLPGNLWKVFEMRGGIITALNEIAFSASVSEIE